MNYNIEKLAKIILESEGVNFDSEIDNLFNEWDKIDKFNSQGHEEILSKGRNIIDANKQEANDYLLNFNKDVFNTVSNSKDDKEIHDAIHNSKMYFLVGIYSKIVSENGLAENSWDVGIKQLMDYARKLGGHSWDEIERYIPETRIHLPELRLKR